jgi:GT2 family glycosyltransferase
VSVPPVSVVTPSLDPGAPLQRCLDSVAAQTYPDVEHIVVDGGSTDGTVALLRAAGVRFVSEPDDGQAAAINKGVRLARGELIGWLNADDSLMPEGVAAAVAALAESPDAGWAYGDCMIVEANGESALRRPGRVEGPASFYRTNPVAQPGTLVARHALDAVGALDESLELAMDFDLWLRLTGAGFAGVYVPRTLASFEITGTSKTGSVGWFAFLREESFALWKIGRPDEAALKLGEAAAWAAHAAGTVTRSGLAGEVAAALGWAGNRSMVVRPADVRAGAALTATALERSRARFAHLAQPELWLNPLTRRKVLTRAAGRMLGRR